MPSKGPVHPSTVVITRPPDQAEHFERLLLAAQIPVRLLPTITIEPLVLNHHQEIILDRLLAGDFHWLIFSSANAVRALAAAVDGRGDIPKLVRCAAQGPKTAEAVKQHLRRSCDLVPQISVAEPFAEELRRTIPVGSTVLLPSAERTRGVLDSTLDKAGIQVTHLPLYRTVPAPYEAELSKRLLDQVQQGAIVSVFSPSAVEGVANLLDCFDKAAVTKEPGVEKVGRSIMNTVRFATIGPITTRAVVERGGRVVVEASDHTDEGLIRAIIQELSLER